jgi:hypothetical protein
MEAKTKKALIIGSSILVGTIGLYFITKAIISRIKKAQDKKDRDLIKEDLKPKPLQAEVDDAKNYNPSVDVKLIGDYIVGYNWNYYPDEINPIIARLTDARLKKLATAYKNKYKISLYQNLLGEWVMPYGVNYDPSIKRLLALGLK